MTDSGKPPAEAARLSLFIGEWLVHGTLTSDGVAAPVAGTWRFERSADGWGVVGSLRTEIGGMGAFEEAELIGFDSVERSIHLFSMNKYAIRDHIGGWVGDDRLVVSFVGTNGGKEVTEEITVDFAEQSRIVGEVVERVDGVVSITTSLVMTISKA